MRNLLALVGLAVVGFFGLGWYLGWYTFAVAPTPDGKKRISFDVDTVKIAADAKQAGDKVGTLLHNAGTPTTAPSAARLPEPAPEVRPEPSAETGGVRLAFPKER